MPAVHGTGIEHVACEHVIGGNQRHQHHERCKDCRADPGIRMLHHGRQAWPGPATLLVVLMQVVGGMRGLPLIHAQRETRRALDDLVVDQHGGEHEGALIACRSTHGTEDNDGIDQHSPCDGLAGSGFKVSPRDPAGCLRPPGALAGAGTGLQAISQVITPVAGSRDSWRTRRRDSAARPRTMRKSGQRVTPNSRVSRWASSRPGRRATGAPDHRPAR